MASPVVALDVFIVHCDLTGNLNEASRELERVMVRAALKAALFVGRRGL